MSVGLKNLKNPTACLHGTFLGGKQKIVKEVQLEAIAIEHLPFIPISSD